MRSDPGAGSPQGLLFHELPTADMEVHHEAQPSAEADHQAEPDSTARGGLREEWWRAWLVGTAAALMTAGVTTGVLLSHAEQFFAARAPGVAAVYRQPRSFDPDTGGLKYVSFVGVDAGLADPAARLDSYLRSAASGHAGVRFRAVAAGPGGTGECVSFAGSAGQE